MSVSAPCFFCLVLWISILLFFQQGAENFHLDRAGSPSRIAGPTYLLLIYWTGHRLYIEKKMICQAGGHAECRPQPNMRHITAGLLLPFSRPAERSALKPGSSSRWTQSLLLSHHRLHQRVSMRQRQPVAWCWDACGLWLAAEMHAARDLFGWGLTELLDQALDFSYLGSVGCLLAFRKTILLLPSTLGLGMTSANIWKMGSMH
jgi:hypothetical protein